MSFEADLVFELSTIAGLSGKVYPLHAPAKDAAGNPVKAPYVIYISSAGVPVKTLNGFTGSKQIEAELNILADDYDELKALQSSVISKLESFERRVIGAGGLFIQELTYETPAELYEPLPNLYRSHINFKVHF